MAAANEPEILMFAPFTSQIDVSFFQEVASRKLNEWGLSVEAKTLEGTYKNISFGSMDSVLHIN